ncbi:hypothetical protein [Streptococcus suis]|uniref:hypothetical protein n=1 Tax=Streptococcus suis TaxID=1307 RepID=UPI0039089165
MRGKKFKDFKNNFRPIIQVSFYKMDIDENFYKCNNTEEKHFTTWAEVLECNEKDYEYFNGIAIESLLKLRMRDPLSSYNVSNLDSVKIENGIFANTIWRVSTVHKNLSFTNFIEVYITK